MVTSVCQDWLELDVSKKFFSHWASSKWHKFKSDAEIYNMKGALFVGPRSPKHATELIKFEDWVFSTALLLSMLAKWTTTLDEPQCDNASGLLKQILDAALPTRLSLKLSTVHPPTPWPESLWPLAAADADTIVIVDSGNIDLSPVAGKSPDLRQSRARESRSPSYVSKHS